MTEQQLKEINQIKWALDQLKEELKDIDEILNYYEDFGSDISFTRNTDSKRRSFGSKKHNIKQDLKIILEKIKIDKMNKIKEFEDKFSKL